MLRSSKPRSGSRLQRDIDKYTAKLAQAKNPTQRNYASSMLRQAQAAQAKAQEGLPERIDDDAIDLHPSEYQSRE